MTDGIFHRTTAFPVAQTVKNLLVMQETWVRSLNWEDPQVQGVQPSPVFLPGESPWTDEPGGYSPWCCKESDMTEQLSTAQHRTKKISKSVWRHERP